MSENTPSIFDLVDILMSTGLSPETSLKTAKEIDARFGLSTRSSGSDEATRERWRVKKARQRANRGNVPGGQSGSTIREVNNLNSVEDKKKKSKSETMSPGTSPGDKVKRSKGDVLPIDWKPTEQHYAKGVELGMTPQVVDGFAARMRNWADANAHRQVARKAGIRGWNAAFSNWLISAHERNNNAGGPNAKTQGASGSKVGFAGLGARLRERAAADDLLPLNEPPGGR